MSDNEDYSAGEEEEDEEQEQDYTENTIEVPEETVKEEPLTENIAGAGLSLLGRVGDNLEYAYLKMTINERALTDVSLIANYKYLQYVDVSRNNLKSLAAFAALPNLLTIDASFNSFTDVDLPTCPYLQILNLSNNKIQTLNFAPQPRLETLNLNNNQLNKVILAERSYPTLNTLELRRNLFNSLAEVRGASQIQRLFIAENEIPDLEGLRNLGNLRLLHLRSNKITTFDGVADNLTKLEYLNMRGNNVEDVEEIKKLTCLTALLRLNLADNPVAEEAEYRLQTLVAIRSLDSLDKEKYEEDERNEANEVRVQEARAAANEALAKEEEAMREKNES